jgi:hypothetical protein
MAIFLRPKNWEKKKVWTKTRTKEINKICIGPENLN